MSRARNVAWIAACLSAATASIVWVHSLKKADSAVRKDEDVGEVIRALQSKVSRLETAAQWQTERVTRHDERLEDLERGASDAGPPAAVGSASNTPPQHTPDEMEFETQLEVKFHDEPRDPRWGREAASEATRALSTDLPVGSTLGAVDCRTNLCRVESSHPSVEAFRSFVEAALLSREKKLWNAGFSAQVATQSASGVSAVTFIAREGQSVPAPDPIPN